MKIAYVINGSDFGGSETSLFKLATQMQQRGHVADIVSLKPVGRLGREFQAVGLHVFSLEMAEVVTLRQFVAGVGRLARTLRSGLYDVVHSFLPRANLMSRIANRMTLGAPHVSSERSLNFTRSFWVTRANRLTLRWTSCILAVSPAVRDHIRRRDRVPKHKLRVISNGVDLAAVDATAPAGLLRSQLGISAEQPLLCSVGRLHPVKGHVFLIRALGRLSRKVPSVRLVLVGDGPEEDRLRGEAEAVGVTERVHFLGFRRDSVAVMKACDALILPSLEEGLPVAALEAMAARLPVVGSAVGGLLHVVEPDATGFLVPVGDVPALTGALERLILDPDLARRFGQQGRALAQTSFTLDRVVNETEDLYCELAA